MKSSIKIFILASLLVLPGFFTPKAQAFEPITMILLAPVALEVYQTAEPRMLKGAQYGGRKLVDIGVNMLEIFYLPLGAVKVTLGMPFGYFGSGVKDIIKGVIAPGKLVLNTLALPFSFCGVDI